MARGLLWGAAAAGALYWASKQPGGVKGTWKRLRGTVDEIQKGESPVEAGRRFIRGEPRSTTTETEYPAVTTTTEYPTVTTPPPR